MFAHYRGDKRKAADEAADHAFRDVSAYVSHRSLPSVEGDLLEVGRPISRIWKGRIYIAAPFFEVAQRWLVEEITWLLDSLRVEVFSPIQHVRREGRGTPWVVEKTLESQSVIAMEKVKEAPTENRASVTPEARFRADTGSKP